MSKIQTDLREHAAARARESGCQLAGCQERFDLAMPVIKILPPRSTGYDGPPSAFEIPIPVCRAHREYAESAFASPPYVNRVIDQAAATIGKRLLVDHSRTTVEWVELAEPEA